MLFSLSRSRPIPHLLWRTFHLRLTASPTTHQAQGTPSPCNQACTLSWAGSEIHLRRQSTLTNWPLHTPVLPLSSRHDVLFDLEPWGHGTDWRVLVQRHSITTQDTIVRTAEKQGNGVCFILLIASSCKYEVLAFTSRPWLILMLAGLGYF